MDRPDPTSEWQVEFPLDLTWIASSILLKILKFQGLVETGGVRHAKVPWMINIFGLGANEHIELSMWLKAFTAQAQRRNYQGRALPLS